MITNLPTIRQIQQVFGDGTVQNDIKRFLRHLLDRLPEAVPELRDWEPEISGNSLYFCPSRSWHVVKHDYIAVCIYMEQLLQPAFFGEEDDPMVTLYVPKEWKHSRGFEHGLQNSLPAGFTHRAGNEEFAEEYPIWKTVFLKPFVKQNKLDINGFEKSIVGRTRALVAKQEAIDKLIVAHTKKRASKR